MGRADSSIALISAVDGDNVELELLEDFGADQIINGVITVCVGHDGGLYHWEAMVGAVTDQHISLTILGPPWIQQRRLHSRYVVDLPAKIRRIRQGNPLQAQPVQVVDLSHSGARVVGAVRLEPGGAIELALDVGGGMLAASGLVALAYSDGHGRRVGHVAFTAPDADELRGIDEYLDVLAKRGAA